MGLVFEHKNHFDYLAERLNAPGVERGIKSKLARAVQAQPAFLSQVLARKHCLSLEQADLTNAFFDHGADEADYFLLLVSHDRAGTESLRAYYGAQMQSVLKKRTSFVHRVGKKIEISHEAKGVYYSSWMYAAVHVACTIPRLQTRKALALELQLPSATVGKALDFLEENGLLQRQADLYQPTESWVRLDTSSPHIAKLHTNWRLKAIQNMDVQTDHDMHYSGVFSLDEKTARLVKDRLLEFMNQLLKEIETAPEEGLYSLGLDFFQLKK